MSGSYCFGRFLIDQQHQNLQRMAKKLQVLVEQNAGSHEIGKQFCMLSSQLAIHFSDEESRLQALGLPESIVLAHANDHRRIVAEISTLRADIDQGISLSALNLPVDSWVTQHIEVYDRPLANFLKG